MNPLSPLTYTLRHKRQTLLLLSLISLMTLGVCTMVRLLDSLPENYQVAGNYLTRVSRVSANGGTLDPALVAQIRTHPGVAQVIQEKGLGISLPPIISEHYIFGVTETDMQTLLNTCNLHLKEGRLPQARSNELALSQEMVAALGLQIGNHIDRTVGRDWTGESWYDGIPKPLELVGILESREGNAGIRLGLVSYEYVTQHEAFVSPWQSGLVILPQEGQKAEVDAFLENEITDSRVEVATYHLLTQKAAGLAGFFYLLFGIVDIGVTVVMALVMSVIHQIFQAQRLETLGVLNALGHSKPQLVRRTILEVVVITVIGWLLGLGLAWGFFSALKVSVYDPRGLVLNLTKLTSIWFSLPIPLASLGAIAISTRRTLARLDAVAIVERGKLSTESEKQASRIKHQKRSQPLSAALFYQRHRRRGTILFAAMGLMILAVSFPAFLFAPIGDAMQSFAEPLRQLAIVTPRMDVTVDPAITAQVRAHPIVAHAIPAIDLKFDISVPPLDWPISIYGVGKNNLHTLMALYGVQVKMGRLPQPYTNEVVLSEAVALNRSVSIGEKIGMPINENDKNIPTELEVVGILSRPSVKQAQDDLWLGFASYEYLSQHERYANHPIHLLTIPEAGQKATLDTWMREEIDGELVEVLTYAWMRNNYRLMSLLILAVFGGVEIVIALVATVALTVLSYIFFTQRREEFGILHAIGRSRAWLVKRTAGEMTTIIAIAWGISALVCGLGLACIQVGLYTPKGLHLNFFNPMPWLFTLPIPIAVLAATTGSVARVLRKLDPVAIIERR